MSQTPDSKPESSTEPEASLKLLLMRHAKSDWSGENVADHDRPLNPRGRRDGPAMARWFADFGHVPDCILCSSAKRTEQTAALMESYWRHLGVPTPAVIIRPELYLARAETIFDCISKVGTNTDEKGVNFPRTVMVLGHNPGISHAASWLAESAIGLPTAAVAVYQCDLPDWSNFMDHAAATLIEMMKPKAL
ncbi:MAG: SixA phosphatase family protein [Rhodopirellula sp. JB044]|uniref:SixA phosphatase family protein n=1 Tax=Rhodopirellula sp. JB044 TaxID=3342844 RepID=UPI003709EDF1